MRIFERIEPPRRQAHLPINRHATWHTWSAEFRTMCGEWKRFARRLPAPRVVEVRGAEPYCYTYDLRLTSVNDEPLADALRQAAAGLLTLTIGPRIMLLTEMIDHTLSGRELHFLLSYLRSAIVHETKNPMAALYSPLGETGSRLGGFALHSDLYVPQVLLNIYEDVPRDGSGASIFLSVDRLRGVLPRVTRLSEAVRRRIIGYYIRRPHEDHYDELFDLLHGKDHPWTRDLESEMHARQLRAKLRRGQGYLVHDRKWLHGREAPSRGVSKKRLHRLIFDTRRT